ncbi:PucR family transcriptional regulator [Kutzneria sp. NPDC052558]|uniref:PucR family transcriptional regulator n=1 Tax=Kutzneria sp. NPDC052558 TaxID=3364121 RepID=UPI0037C9C21E
MNEVQHLTDGLAEELRRSVEVDDCDLRPLAISEQFEPVDAVRVQSVLARRSSPEVMAYALSRDIVNATGPVRYPANADLGTLPRVCVPLRVHEDLLGYLWLIDSPPVTESELAQVSHAAADIAKVLHRDAVKEKTELDHEQDLVAELIVGHGLADDLAERVPAAGILTASEPFSVIVVRVNGSASTKKRRFLHDLTRARPIGRSLLGYADGAVTLVLSARDRATPFVPAVTRAAARHGLSSHGGGFGPLCHDLADLPDTHRKAVYAATVARATGEESLSWSQLGSDAAFYGLAWTVDTVMVLCPEVGPLLNPEHQQLRETVETYLACGADTQQAAKQLTIHRTTLYYRLNRVSELLGPAWSGGHRRLGLQLALRLDRLIRNGGEEPVR